MAMEKGRREKLERPSVAPFAFPPHRRSHLKSEAFRTLVRILFHCSELANRSHPLQIAPADPERDNSGQKLEQAVGNEIRSMLVHSDGTDCDKLSKQKMVDKNSETNEDGGYVQSQVILTEPIMRVEGNGMALKQINPVDKITEVSGASGFSHSQVIANDIRPMTRVNGKVEGISNINLLSSLTDGNGTGDNVFALKSNQKDQFDKQQIAVGSQAPDLCFKNDTTSELQYKKMVFDKSVYGSSKTPICLTEDGEVEEGEISGDLDISGQSNALFLEDAAASKEKKVEEQICEGVVDTVGDSDIGPDVEVKGRSGEVKRRNILKGKWTYQDDCVLEAGRNVRQDGGSIIHCVADCTDDPGEKQQKPVTENHVSSKEKDGSASNKRRKGPCSKEKKEKKKQRKRKKRAELNRQLGVKRLKLHPVLKPKPVTYCRHYLKGRCQQGEKCNYSHDTVPLTKSTPCCHFARHSCMKGDDCPFDHQLSKYPCNNFVSTGFCIRGDSCSFSHKILPEDNSPSSASGSNISKPDLIKKMPSCSIAISPVVNTEKKVAGVVLKPPSHAPKGISFLSIGKSPLSSSYNNQGTLDKVQNSTGTPVRTSTPKRMTPQASSADPTRDTIIEQSFEDEKFASEKPENSSMIPASAGHSGTGTSSSSQKTLLSTLAFAARYESERKKESRIRDTSGNLGNESVKASKILDFLCGGIGSSMKQ